jgi:outer membrane protein
MKKLLTLTCVFGLSVFAALPARAQLAGIGIVDMDKIFKSYYKTKDAESRINDARASAKREMDDRMDLYNKDLEAINKLQEEVKNPALSGASRDEKAKSLDEKVGKIRASEREIKEFQANRENDLKTQALRMRNGIVEEITKVVQDEVKANNYRLVLDKSGMSLNGVPIILYADGGWDFSDKVIAALNKNKPAGSEITPPPASAEKPTKPTKIK